MKMNPLSLLTKGHTIRGLKERTGTYKLLDKSTLPDFSSPKRPAPTTPHPAPAPERPQPALLAEPGPDGPKPGVQTEAPKAASVEQASRPAEGGNPAAPPIWKSAIQGLARIWKRLARRKAAPFGSPTVQTELALDKVTVIRNDLSEDDLEVVAAEKKTKAGAPAENTEKQTANP
jgi:hypothetical protein